MAQSKSSKRWLKEHFADPYVKRAQQEGYRSRAAYKLLEIQEKDKLLKPGMVVVDLGAAPGGWSQLITRFVGKKGKVFALDILPMDTLPDVEFIQGDFREEEVLQTLLQRMEGVQVDVLLSDMAPNMSGIPAVDQSRMMYLAELGLELAQKILRTDGTLLLKIFQGSEFDSYLLNLRKLFKQVLVRKPQASRARSAEVYLLAKGYKGSV
jgi:23S rRNA (uridine2552-2'-O)-methyltransferase